jgi:3'(2'), 5'-bisphosphate nucleotidase
MSSIRAPDSLLAELRVIARRAGEVILEQYRGFEVSDIGNVAALRDKIGLREKADRSPVTTADEAAERVILDALALLTPEIPVVSEEAHGRSDDVEAMVSADRFFLVDPLDGTQEFLTKNGEFTVNIALIEHGIPVAGVVHAPALGHTWFGARAAGAFRGDFDQTPSDIRTRRPPATGLVAVTSRRHGDTQALERFLRGRLIQRTIATGSSLKFCVLAAGEADVYPRFGRTMEWDTAAGHAVLLAAGGSVLTVEGEPLSYGKRGFENPHFVAWGSE